MFPEADTTAAACRVPDSDVDHRRVVTEPVGPV